MEVHEPQADDEVEEPSEFLLVKGLISLFTLSSPQEGHVIFSEELSINSSNFSPQPSHKNSYRGISTSLFLFKLYGDVGGCSSNFSDDNSALKFKASKFVPQMFQVRKKFIVKKKN